MNKYYITFGQAHPNAGCYHIIEAGTKDQAQALAFERFGQLWSMIYESAEAAGVERWNLRELK